MQVTIDGVQYSPACNSGSRIGIAIRLLTMQSVTHWVVRLSIRVTHWLIMLMVQPLSGTRTTSQGASVGAPGVLPYLHNKD